MTKPVAKTPTALLNVRRDDALAAARGYAAKARAASTLKAYATDWRIFEGWCQSVELLPLPAAPATVAMFLSVEADDGRAPSTLSRRLAAIHLMHSHHRLPPPHPSVEVNEVMKGIRNAAQRPASKKAAAVEDTLRRMLDTVPDTTHRGRRDRALLLLGFFGAFRRSELVALCCEDLEREPGKGLRVTIRRSKTNQGGPPEVIAVQERDNPAYCPVAAMTAWTTSADISAGHLFWPVAKGDHVRKGKPLTAQSVALILKKYARAAGLDPARFAGHSLRSGFITSAARNRASVFKIREVSRHKSLQMLQEYVREGGLFDDHAGATMLDEGNT